MAHFAQINENNEVDYVIVVSNDDCGGGNFPDSEPIGQAFIADVLQLPGVWLQCSYNANFRSCYPGPGYSYDPDTDAFVPPVINDSEPIDETE